MPHLWSGRMSASPPTVLGLAVVLALSGPARAADVYYMTDGDRVSGKTLSQGGGFYKVDTPYGRVAIPKGRVARIVHDDGREELLNGGAVAPHAQAPAAGPVHLVVVFTGDTFWQAWNEKDGAPSDPSLRLQITLDEEPLVSYVDAKMDPDIPGAAVNSFSFPDALVSRPGPTGIVSESPEVRPGRITVKLDLPMEAAGEHGFRVSYQENDGTTGSPAWRDLVGTQIHVNLKTDASNVVEIHQDRGAMEYSGLFHKKMKNVESFRIEARAS
jgi:hypothetical protein